MSYENWFIDKYRLNQWTSDNIKYTQHSTQSGDSMSIIVLDHMSHVTFLPIYKERSEMGDHNISLSGE